MTEKEQEKGERLGYIRWMPNRGLPKITAEVFSAFYYKEDILERLKWMHPTETIEFLDRGRNVVMVCTVKMVREVLGHVSTAVEKIDFSSIDFNDLTKIRYASPWHFWKDKTVQETIKKFVR